MHPDDLRQLIDDELKRLPTPRAPESLLPRVLAATAARHRSAPFYARPWLSWPLGWQVASVALVCATVVAGLLLGGPVLRPLTQAQGTIGRTVDSLATAATIARLAWKFLLAPAAFVSLVFVVSLTLAGAAIWVVLERVALGGASQQ
jgi:hypothetical protein